MSDLPICTICDQVATGTYEGYPVCDSVEHEFEIQAGLDMMDEKR